MAMRPDKPVSKQGQDGEVPTPEPGLVHAARDHLSGRYARGVEQFLWETSKHPLADIHAISAVVMAAEEEKATGPDLAAALVLAQAHRLDSDRLEHDLMNAALNTGLDFDAIAAVLEMSSGAEAEAHYRFLQARRRVPVDTIDAPQLSGDDMAAERAEQARRRAQEAAERAEQATKRRDELAAARDAAADEPETDPDADPVEVAAELARNAGVLTRQARMRAIKALLNSAHAHERSAEAYQNLSDMTGDPERRTHYQRLARRHRHDAKVDRDQAHTFQSLLPADAIEEMNQDG